MIRICMLCLFLEAGVVCGQSLSDATLQKISFDQKLGGTVSLDLPFRDESGQTVRLGKYFGKKPVILVLGYYGCPMLCTLVLNGMASTLQDIKLEMGRDYQVVNVSIDPHENPALAAAKKRSYVTRFGQPSAATGWHFLTGDEPAIHLLAREVGFNYVYDPVSRQFAHPSGLVVLAPDGRISHYLLGVAYSTADLSHSLADAQEAKVGSPVANLFLLCFHYNPFTGKYSNVIMRVVRVTGVAVMVALLGFIILSRRRAPSSTANANVSHG
jgi:protein SCO1/2